MMKKTHIVHKFRSPSYLKYSWNHIESFKKLGYDDGGNLIGNKQELRKRNEQMMKISEMENSYIEKVFAPLGGLVKEFNEEMMGYSQYVENRSKNLANEFHGNYIYRSEYLNEEDNFPAYTREEISNNNNNNSNGGGGKEIILDTNVEGIGHKYISIGMLKLSGDQKYVAFTKDTTGEELYSAIVRKINNSNSDNSDIIIDGNNIGSVELNHDGGILYYTEINEKDRRPYKVFRVNLRGINCNGFQKHLIYEETDDDFFLDLGRTKDNRFVTISSHSKRSSEIFIIDEEKNGGDLISMKKRSNNQTYFLDHGGNE